jgi:uncharacterized membrane protein (DUF4010 family)
VVLILALQAAGHVAGRVLGARAGLALAGLFSGFVSSTATIVAMGSRVRAATAGDHAAEAATAGALASTVATWLQVLMLVAALAPAALPALLPVSLAGAALAGATALWVWRRVPAGAAAPGPEADPLARRGPLRVREALIVAALLAAVATGVASAQQHFGTLGVFGGTALAALADAHAPVAALATLQSAGSLPTATLLQGVLLAVTANALTRSLAAFTAGGRRYGLQMVASLALSTAAAAAVALGLGA